MNWIELDWIELTKFALPVLAAVVGWVVNESAKRRTELRQRKEERYRVLLDSLQGFGGSADPATSVQDRDRFLRQLELCWLYCPVSVVRAGYAFMDLVTEGVRVEDEKRQQAVGTFLMAIRRDLRGWDWWTDRKLNPKDFQMLQALSSEEDAGPMGYTLVPFHVRTMMGADAVQLMVPLHVTRKELDRWQERIRMGRWSDDQSPVKSWREYAMSQLNKILSQRFPTDADEVPRSIRNHMSFHLEDLTLNRQKFASCQWEPLDPIPLQFPHDQVRSGEG